MRSFTHLSATTVHEACALLRRYKGKAALNAGGTDLLLALKGEHLFDYPECVIDIKTIPGLDGISQKEGALRIGALTKLSHLAGSPLVLRNHEALAEAALAVATPQIRNVATIGGNLCQDIRCWYYRYPRRLGGPLHCLRKGEGPCLAVAGDNRYHVIMGGKKCFAACPSDTAVALAALDAVITIAGVKGERTVPVKDFFTPLGNGLGKGEMVTSIEIPAIRLPTRQTFLKFTLRKPVEFAIVSVAALVVEEQGVCTGARIALGAVAPGPLRASEAEQILEGRTITPGLAEEAARAALAGAKPLSMNAYKVEIAKTLVKRAVLGKGSG